MSNRAWLIVAMIVIVPLTIALVMWLWVLASPDPTANMVAPYFPWPVVCSSKGCVTTTAWRQHFDARRTFANTTKEEQPNSAQALETLILQHLARHAFLRSPVSHADASRYREEILNIKDEAQLREAVGLTLAQYDQGVIVPYLQQEALRQQRKVETVDELYQQLSHERWLVVLPFGLGWDKEKAVVTTNSLYVPAPK